LRKSANGPPRSSSSPGPPFTAEPANRVFVAVMSKLSLPSPSVASTTWIVSVELCRSHVTRLGVTAVQPCPGVIEEAPGSSIVALAPSTATESLFCSPGAAA
jgi:hypothetical protein